LTVTLNILYKAYTFYIHLADWKNQRSRDNSLDLFFFICGVMMISKKTKYALKAMEYLAQHSNGRPVLISELAEAEKIPKKFLEFILLSLRKGDLLTSRIGKGGGYSLARDPSEISLGSIIRILEGGMSLVHCVDGDGARQCEDGNDPACCGIHLVMSDLKKSINTILEVTTLADIIKKKDSANQVKFSILDYCI
jgi:Rrf2 family protein